MKEYPKIDTLYNRGADFTVDTNVLRRQEFGMLKQWNITEKIDGTNIRIGLNPDGSIELGGKTSAAQIPASIVSIFNDMDKDAIRAAFNQDENGNYPEVVIFGEGYGSKIQNGNKYRDDVSIIVFDVVVGQWWLSRANVADVANKIGLDVVPEIGGCTGIYLWLPRNEQDLRDILDTSIVAYWNDKSPIPPEGIVARPDPMLYFATGKPIMWKLKYSDFRKGKK